MILFSHSGNMGDLLYSLYMVTELSEHLGMPAWLHLQTNVHFDYSYQTHPNGDVGFTQANVEFMRPLLETIPLIRKITFGDEIPPHDGVAVDLSMFRRISIDLLAGNLPRYYYNLVNLHLPQDLSRQLISVEPDYSLRDRIVLVHSTRYCNALLKLDGLAKYRDRLVFMGLKAEHEAFCSKWFDVEYRGISNALEFARLLRGSGGIISNQNGLYAIAELMKVPRVILSYEYGMINGKIMPGSPINLPVGGWYEMVQSPVKFDSAVANLMQRV